MADLCVERRVNRRVRDFLCNSKRGHPGAHSDPVTGHRWAHPFRGLPYGMRHGPPSNGARGKTKQGVSYSVAPAKGSAFDKSSGVAIFTQDPKQTAYRLEEMRFREARAKC